MVGEEALPTMNGDAVAVHVGAGRAVRLENTTPPAFFVEKSEIMCWTKAIFPAASFARTTPGRRMRLQRRHDVVEAVAVDVVDAHPAPPAEPRPF